ncbi:hypothetical protein EJ05DRAFT_504069 [Pseudovirgaria hyperparasitica]|uniref:DUF2293 domain-containing protein n=1 Tax=Pseudovirgaria hyperparasitica TaxID=470096 RepID=A0A6A6VXW7_9PEZI|nr:uncharacterized protein EJ05DRAFT_504069 [Pseudovirgaria hyperparasitica]KAF2754534.1 hypothetical protein EJ05DRAFT_504069 [Pseudovirgaria hyperparasitica]
MVLVERRGLAARSARAPSRVEHRKKKPYKVVLESVTAEKKKLRSAVSYDAQSPEGYTFVPAGIPELSEFCKELCRKRSLVVHIVSATPKNKASTDPEKISHHLHRVGYHFPNAVVDQACDWLGYSIRGGQYRKDLDVLATSRLARSLAGHSKRLGLDQGKGSEDDTKTQVRSAIRDLFPKIPDKDLGEIVQHAFRKGTKRVGNAQELSLPRRVQLAVIAHIRHVYTDYDKLLKSGTYLEARAKVEQPCLDQLMEWRGEIDDGESEFEDIFRETIVIDSDNDDDDDDDDDDSADESVNGHARGHSLEIVSRQAAAHDLQPEDYPQDFYTGNSRSFRARRRIVVVPSSQKPDISYMRPVTNGRTVRTRPHQPGPSIVQYTDRKDYVPSVYETPTTAYPSAYAEPIREVVYVREYVEGRLLPSVPASNTNVVYRRPNMMVTDPVILRRQHTDADYPVASKYAEPPIHHSRPSREYKPQHRRALVSDRIAGSQYSHVRDDDSIKDHDMPIPSIEDTDAHESMRDLRLAAKMPTSVEPQLLHGPGRDAYGHEHSGSRRTLHSHREQQSIPNEAHTNQQFHESHQDYYVGRSKAPQYVTNKGLISSNVRTSRTGQIQARQIVPQKPGLVPDYDESYIPLIAESPRTQSRYRPNHSDYYTEPGQIHGEETPSTRSLEQAARRLMSPSDYVQSPQELEQEARRLMSPSDYRPAHESHRQYMTNQNEKRIHTNCQASQSRRLLSGQSQNTGRHASVRLKEPFITPREYRSGATRQSPARNEGIRNGNSEDPIIIQDSPPRKKRSGVAISSKNKQPAAQRRTNMRSQHKERKMVDPDQPEIPRNSGVVPRKGLSGNGVVAERALAEQVWDNY